MMQLKGMEANTHSCMHNTDGVSSIYTAGTYHLPPTHPTYCLHSSLKAGSELTLIAMHTRLLACLKKTSCRGQAGW